MHSKAAVEWKSHVRLRVEQRRFGCVQAAFTPHVASCIPGQRGADPGLGQAWPLSGATPTFDILSTATALEFCPMVRESVQKKWTFELFWG